MGWSLGYDNRWDRDIGYGAPACCAHPRCGVDFDRGLAEGAEQGSPPPKTESH